MLLGPVYTDNREKTPPPEMRQKELLARGVPCVVANLQRGDYQWVVMPEPKDVLPPMAVVCERKSIRDLIASAADGRIARFWQGAVEEAMDGAEQVNVLLLEGDQFRQTGFGDASWDANRLDNLLFSLQTAGVVVARTRSSEDCADRIASLWRYTGRADRGLSLRKVYAPDAEGSYLNPSERAAVRSLMGLPGWGESRVRAALSVLGSPGAVLAALMGRDYKAFAAVHGVGKGLVDSAAEFLARVV